MWCHYVIVPSSLLRNLRSSCHTTLLFNVTTLILRSPRRNSIYSEFGVSISKQEIRQQNITCQAFFFFRGGKLCGLLHSNDLHLLPAPSCRNVLFRSVHCSVLKVTNKHSVSPCLFLQMTRYNRQRVLSLQASLVQYAESRLKNGRDTYAILAKLLNDLKKSS